jgi:rubrerythrin
MDLRGSQTEKNLLTAFAGESQARNRYTYYASVARNEGYIQIMKIFEETADQEKEHAKRFFKYLQEAGSAVEVEVKWNFPTGPLATTEENLRAAAAGEKYEFSEMYPSFADIAEKEGFMNIAHTWRMVAKAETWHHDRYIALADNIAKGTVFQRNEKVQWVCQNCGYVHTGDKPPEKCPACEHPKAYFKIHNPKF